MSSMETMEQLSAVQLIANMGKKAREASTKLALLKPEVKNQALVAMANAFEEHAGHLQEQNDRDLASAKEHGLTEASIDRLRLTDARIGGMATALREIAALPDPVGEVTEIRTRPNGIRVGRMQMPIGVIGIIYESRPNVTADAGALCLKSGNSVILRGGSEALHSNRAIAQLMNKVGQQHGIPEGAVQLVPTADREAVGALLHARDYVDVIIPRGGRSLIERVVLESLIPVIKHYDGNCTVFIDENADLRMAEEIAFNAKVQRPGVCNAAENLLVHEAVAKEFLPRVAKRLIEAGVELRGCVRTCSLLPEVKKAEEDDWKTEYLDLILAVKIVDSFEEAVSFINTHGSRHTDAIVTQDYQRAMTFTRAIDSACVHVNCSTRFSDGTEYGLGAEIGISTDKLHARGPMGLRELTTSRWVVFGEGQVRG